MNTLIQSRNFRTLWVMTIALACSGSAFAQQHYKITDLGFNNSKENFSMAMGLNKWGWTENMDGFVRPPETSTSTTIAWGRAVISIYGINVDLGTLGKPDGNSWINWNGINDLGEAAGLSETAEADPTGEDICNMGTHLKCVPFFWREGTMRALPTFGGNNGQASGINNRGEVVGFAEDGAVDQTCTPGSTINNRVALAALWKKGDGEDFKAEALPLVDHDPDGNAYGINDEGHAVGYSGNCTTAAHAVMWKDKTVFVLKDLGGTGSNFAYTINNRGQIAGQVGSADNKTFYAAVWQHGADGKVTKIDLLPGDFAAFATGINDRGQVVGNDFDSKYSWAHGFIWNDGVTTDLNELIPADSNLFIISASNINDRGQISGMATVQAGPHKGYIHAYLLTPTDEHIDASMADFARANPDSIVSANVCNHFSQKFGPSRLQR